MKDLFLSVLGEVAKLRLANNNDLSLPRHAVDAIADACGLAWYIMPDGCHEIKFSDEGEYRY